LQKADIDHRRTPYIQQVLRILSYFSFLGYEQWHVHGSFLYQAQQKVCREDTCKEAKSRSKVANGFLC
jgi:hypothetical protein